MNHYYLLIVKTILDMSQMKEKCRVVNDMSLNNGVVLGRTKLMVRFLKNVLLVNFLPEKMGVAYI